MAAASRARWGEGSCAGSEHMCSGWQCLLRLGCLPGGGGGSGGSSRRQQRLCEGSPPPLLGSCRAGVAPPSGSMSASLPNPLDLSDESHPLSSPAARVAAGLTLAAMTLLLLRATMPHLLTGKEDGEGQEESDGEEVARTLAGELVGSWLGGARGCTRLKRDSRQHLGWWRRAFELPAQFAPCACLARCQQCVHACAYQALLASPPQPDSPTHPDSA